MEPLDPAKNDEGGGFSKRRISSILKAPRKSIRFPDPQQQEKEVECAKPVEKRISRRVSFAPANDVLLFSKDVKNASPVRSPLQELITTTATATQNRVQVAEDGIQQIMGMETLLNAPLHAAQQRDMVNHNTRADLGEKTMIFSTDDAFMDMTHSHTINIADDAELLADISLQNYGSLPTRGEKTVMLTVNDGSMTMTQSQTVNLLPTTRNMDLSVKKRNVSSSSPSMDPGFENFLASLSKPNDPGINPVITRKTCAPDSSPEEANSSHNKIQRADKENQAPTSVSAVMEKSLNTSKKIGELSYGSALCLEEDLSMDMTEAQTGGILGFTDDDPLQCLFPTQEMYSRHDNRLSQTAEKTKPKQSSKSPASLKPKDTTYLKNPSLQDFNQRNKGTLDSEGEFREKTMMVTAGHEFMDVTRCHTVNIESGSLAPPNQNLANASSVEERKHGTCVTPGSSAHSMAPGFKNLLSSLSNADVPSGNPAVARMVPSKAASSKESVDKNNSLSQFQSKAGKENQSLNTTRSVGGSFNGGGVCSENDGNMDITATQTGRIIGLTGSDDPFQFLFPTQDMFPCHESLKKQMNSGKKNSEMLGSSNRKETPLKPALKTMVQRNQDKFDTEDDCRDKTVRFAADNACMDVTQSHTVNIVTGLDLQSLEDSVFLPTCGEKTAMFTANNAAMDMTLPLARNVVSDSPLPVKKHKAETSGLPRNTYSSAGGLDPRFYTSVSTPSVPSVRRMTPTTAQCSEIGDSWNGVTISPEDDVSMDMTEAQTGCILGIPVTDGPLQCLFPTPDMYTQSGSLKKVETASQQQHNETLGSFNRKGMDTSMAASLKKKMQKYMVQFEAEDECREKTVRFTADDACMDVTRSHTVNIDTEFQLKSNQNVDLLPTSGEKTVRFTADDACMDVTRSHTVNIDTDLHLQSHKNMDLLPTSGEKTVRFTADDACMDVTRSHTVNIATEYQMQSHQNVDFLPASGEKTVRFTADNACMDVTRSHTVNIATEFQLQSLQNVDLLPTSGEKTVRFTADDACMDVTRSHTVNIDTDLHLQSHRNVDVLPASGEKTVRFTADDACMDVTRSHTVNIDTGSSNILSTHETTGFPLAVEKTHHLHRNRSSSANTLDPGFKNSLSRTSGPWANPVTTRAVAPAEPSHNETDETNGFLDQRKTQKPCVDSAKEAPCFLSAVKKKPNETMAEGLEEDVSMVLTEAQRDCTFGQTHTDEPRQCISSTHDSNTNSDHLKKTKVTSDQSNEGSGSSNPDAMEIPNLPDSLNSNETGTPKELKPRNQTCTLSQKVESPPSAVDHDVDAAPSRKSRRMSLADLQSKVKRLSHIVNTAPDAVAMDSCIAPLPQPDHATDKNLNDKTKSLPVTEPELQMGLVNTIENTEAQSLTQGEQPLTSTTTTPFNLKTKQLMSRLSVGSFKAKLPQRSKPDDPKKVNSMGEHTRTLTVNVTKQQNDFDDDLSNIYNEELESYEDMSETLDISPQNATEKTMASHELDMEELQEEDVYELDFIGALHGKKRPLPEDENNMEDEKRMKTSAGVTTDVETSRVGQCDGNISTAPNATTQTTDYSNSSHTASTRCEATFESTFKQSLFESQLEDYTNDVQRKLEDGTITVLEFFKLFNIDFVIHNPRQSILPGRLLSDTDRTPMDLLKDRHINRPKQMVYETDVLQLTEKVEGLKERMQDLDKPMKIVNRPLWEEVRYSSEKELKSFEAKLKERYNLFRKLSKVQSHEMKEVLYTNLVRANLEEQQRSRRMIEEADGMLKSLDDCICELETELAVVEEKGFGDKPSLQSYLGEMQKVTEALADDDRQLSELEMQKKQNTNKLNRLKAETKNLESHVTVLHMVNEWKLAEKSDNCTVYTFLHDTLHLQLVYEKSSGNDADDHSEKKISDITFKLQLDGEKSQGHARLVHKLLSQYIDGESDRVAKYPTSRHVPNLLNDVGLVVSRCRLLGEELRLLKMWGGMRLGILDISCVDTEVHIVFSVLKTFSKFEVIFSVSLIDHLYALRMQSFKNMIGNTTIQQIEEIVASSSPGKNLLTKIIKKIHENLLC